MSKLKIFWATFLAFALIGTFSMCESQKAKREQIKNKDLESLKTVTIDDILIPPEETKEADEIISKTR